MTDEELEEARERQEELPSQIERCRTLLEASQRLDPASRRTPFRDALSAALELMGAPPLEREADPAQGRRPRHDRQPRFIFPALDQRAGADPTWADTLDTLRAPRPRDQKPWEWRREPRRSGRSSSRTPGTMDETVVHLHLEHRVVQRLLGRFRSQGFVHHDLSRACLAQTRDSIPRVDPPRAGSPSTAPAPRGCTRS